MSLNYCKQHPFKASIKERFLLSSPESPKKTHHIVLDIEKSGLQYEAGDSIGIFPRHEKALVEKTLKALNATGQEIVVSKHSQEEIVLFDYLTHKSSITTISLKLFRAVAERQTCLEKKDHLLALLTEERREDCKTYIQQREIWDFLIENEEVYFSPQEFSDLLMPLLPRFYSISSSQKFVGNEVHLTVAHLEFESGGHQRKGVCTHFLCGLSEVNVPEIPIFIQPSHGFGLPEDKNAPLVMIGPGTGIAPFRAFMQERIFHHQSKGDHWLFFGERHRTHDFYYEEEWEEFSKHGNLKVHTAFSRDQEHKIYVQHKMQENGEDLFAWLEKGAYLYVCGDAGRMAKDVDAALEAIVKEYGKLEAVAAKNYIKLLRKNKRYLRDVY